MSIWSCLGRLTLRALNKGHMRTGWSLCYVSYMCVNDILLLQNVCALFAHQSRHRIPILSVAAALISGRYRSRNT